MAQENSSSHNHLARYLVNSNETPQLQHDVPSVNTEGDRT